MIPAAANPPWSANLLFLPPVVDSLSSCKVIAPGSHPRSLSLYATPSRSSRPLVSLTLELSLRRVPSRCGSAVSQSEGASSDLLRKFSRPRRHFFAALALSRSSLSFSFLLITSIIFSPSPVRDPFQRVAPLKPIVETSPVRLFHAGVAEPRLVCLFTSISSSGPVARQLPPRARPAFLTKPFRLFLPDFLKLPSRTR